MKKIFLLALAAVGLMACNGNGASTNNADKKMLEKAGADLIGLFQADQTEVESAFKNAGFVVCGSTENNAPKHQMPAESGTKSVLYVYNKPEGTWTGMEGIASEAQQRAFNEIIKAGKCYVEAKVTYVNGKFQEITGQMAVSDEISDVNMIYLAFSNALYEKLPATENIKNWSATIKANGEDTGGKKYDYSQRAAFESAVAAAEHPFVEELANNVSQMATGAYRTLQYNTMWVNTMSADPEDAAEYRAMGFCTYARGYLYASDIQ